jgi:hypothetical protein
MPMGPLELFDLNLNTFHKDFPMHETEPHSPVQHAFIAVTQTTTSRSYAEALMDPEPNVEPHMTDYCL